MLMQMPSNPQVGQSQQNWQSMPQTQLVYKVYNLRRIKYEKIGIDKNIEGEKYVNIDENIDKISILIKI